MESTLRKEYRPQWLMFRDGRIVQCGVEYHVSSINDYAGFKRFNCTDHGWFLGEDVDLKVGERFVYVKDTSSYAHPSRKDAIIVERVSPRELEPVEEPSRNELLLDSVGVGSTILGKILYRVKTTTYEGTYSGWNSQPDQKNDQNVQFWIGNTTAQKIKVLSFENHNKLRVLNLDIKESSSNNEGQGTVNGSVYTATVVRSKTVAAGEGVSTGVVVSEVVYTKSNFVALSDNTARAIALAEAINLKTLKLDLNDPTQPVEVKLVKACDGGGH